MLLLFGELILGTATGESLMCLKVRTNLVLIMNYGLGYVVTLEKSEKSLEAGTKVLHHQMRLPTKVITCSGVPAGLALAYSSGSCLQFSLLPVQAERGCVDIPRTP
jgi:hypothetical protein